MKIRYLIFTVFFVQSVFAQIQDCQQWSDELQKKPLIIGTIIMDVNNVFDNSRQDESRRYHKLANKLHTTTKQHVVERDLLFKEGDVFSQALLNENERIIRARPYIKDAKIIPLKACGNNVTVLVSTQDNWTLTPGISFGQSGGKSKYSFELQEKNLFGLGKSLEFKYKKTFDRILKSIKYNDYNIFGSDKQFYFDYEDNSDGKRLYLNLTKPFLTLDTPTSWTVNVDDHEYINYIYTRGIISNEIAQKHEFYSLNYGKLVKRTAKTIHRLKLGYTHDKNQFFNSFDYSTSTLPDDREYNYPWLSYQYFQENYIEIKNFNSMGRVEDVSLGHHFYAQLGIDQNKDYHYDLRYSKGFAKNDYNLLQLNSYIKGRQINNKVLDLHKGLSVNYYSFHAPKKTFFASVAFDNGENLFLEVPQYLGSETGLRGYPFQYLSASNKFVATLEERFFYNWYPLKTFQFASAFFIDSGAAWNSGESKQFISNIGIGLRLVPTRTSGGQVIHIDFAMPIDDRDSVDSFQISIKAKRSF